MSLLRPARAAPRPVARAKTLLAAFALLTLLSASLFAAHVLADEPSDRRPATHTYRYVDQGEDWFAYADVLSFRGDHVSAHWSTHKGVDRVLLTRMGDVDRLLAGGAATEVIHEWKPGGRDWQRSSLASWDHGLIEFDMPEMTCPPPTGSCLGETRPVMVWLKGDGWSGTPRGSLAVGTHEYQPNGAVGWDGPVAFRYAGMDRALHLATPWYVGLTASFALGALGSALLWWRAARRELAREEPEAAPFRDVGASEMLRLVRLAELYVVTISRYFLLSGAFIVLATGLVMYLALPPLLANAQMHYRFTAWVAVVETTFVLLPLFVAAVAAIFWAAQLREVRRELARWRRFSRGLDEQAAAILAA